MGVRLKWEGEKIKREIRGEFANRVRECMRILATAVRSECPVDSGDLRSTVRIEAGDDKLSGAVVVGDEARGVDYAGWVEFGTSKRRADPFFRRAVYGTQDQIKAVMSRRMSLGERVGSAVRGFFGR